MTGTILNISSQISYFGDQKHYKKINLYSSTDLSTLSSPIYKEIIAKTIGMKNKQEKGYSLITEGIFFLGEKML